MHSFMAATATGVPPRVPSVEIEGTSLVRSSSFDSAALTNPTGAPMIISRANSRFDHFAQGQEC